MTRSLIAILWLGILLFTFYDAAVEAATPFERGVQAEQELRIDEARDLFREALAEAPDTPGLAEHVAWFLFLNGFQNEECRDLLRKAAPQSQEPAAMERAARVIERKLGQRGPADDEEQEAERSFHELIIKRAAEGNDEQLGGALVDAGDFAKGIPLLGEAQAADPTNGPLSLRLARAYVWAQKLPEADAAYEKLLELQPHNPTLLLEQAQVAAGRLSGPGRSWPRQARLGPPTRGSCKNRKAWRRSSPIRPQPRRRSWLRLHRCHRCHRKNCRSPSQPQRRRPCPSPGGCRLKMNCNSMRRVISFGSRCRRLPTHRAQPSTSPGFSS